jgi:hypothetical protein
MNVKVITPQPDGTCQLCGKVDELRPYGPNYEMICFACGSKDMETTEKRFKEWMESDAVTVADWKP